jgi:hypothetical protein
MNKESTLGMKMEAAPETRIWQAVILNAVQDWVTGPLRTKREAETYLFDDQTDFPRVCKSAGMDVNRLRSRLRKFKAHSAGASTIVHN